ncbi:plant-specific domain TIGR01615 family protein [Musa troglodytarum]|uniref:Plant-specific domain TIGR01615 family protein n=1 Tax=Musa troglodytarum TaxID=320322 RepID=A0A9E7H760_9LILI|nr:plant-specific domain TIGR01615 family protein [Musa troglodytarum]
MPFPTKIQPIDVRGLVRSDQAKPVPKSRLKRLFERQFPGVLRISSAERLDLEPSSVCLDKMVRSFMEDNNGEKPSSRCGHSRCNCFHGHCDDSSDDDLDFISSSNGGDAPIVSAAEVIKGLVVCTTVAERNLLADASSVVERSKNFKRKNEHMKAVTDGLRSLGYDASQCKSRWEKTASIPAGKHEYIDVIIVGERLLVDVDFRSEFQIARSTKSYAAVLQSLPSVFVGKEDRVSQIVAVVSEAAQLSLKKKGLYFPPWRKPEYIRSKWLAPFERSTIPADTKQAVEETRASEEKAKTENPRGDASTTDEPGEAEGRSAVATDPKRPKEAVKQSGALEEKAKTENSSGDAFPSTNEPIEAAEGKSTVAPTPPPPTWELPEVKPRTPHIGAKVVTGLASLPKRIAKLLCPRRSLKAKHQATGGRYPTKNSWTGHDDGMLVFGVVEATDPQEPREGLRASEIRRQQRRLTCRAVLGANVGQAYPVLLVILVPKHPVNGVKVPSTEGSTRFQESLL